MLTISLIVSLIIPLILGFATLLMILQKKIEFFNFRERIALAFASGWGIHVIIMFLLSIGKIPLTFTNILAADLVIIMVLIPFTRHLFLIPSKIKELREEPGTRTSGREPYWFWFTAGREPYWFMTGFLLLIIAVKVIFVFFFSFIKPVLDPDIVECYALAAKSIFLNHTFLGAPGVGDKPPLPFLSQAWPTIAINSWNDSLLTLVHPFMFICLLIIFYSVLIRYHPRFFSLIFTFLLSTIPFLVFHVSTAYTDFPQTFYYSIATFYLFLFMKEFPKEKEKANGYLLVGALLLGISVWCKKSGLYYAAINLSVLAASLLFNLKGVEKKDLKSFAGALLLFILVVFPWLTYHKFVTLKGYYIETESNLAETLRFPSELAGSKTQNVLQAIARNAFWEDNWHVLGMLFLAAIFLFPGRALSSPGIYLFAIIGLQFGMLFILFRFTNLYRFIFNETLLNRLTLHFVPVILYFCAETIGEELSILSKLLVKH